MRQVPDVDPDRIGVWGSSYSGGHVIVLAAIDRRIKAAVGQLPLISGFRNVQALVRSDFLPGLRAALDADREARFAGKEPGMIPAVAADPLGPCVMPTPDSWEWFSKTGETRAPSWRNEVTLRSVEMLMEYEPGAYIERVAPTPLCLVGGRRRADTDRAGPGRLREGPRAQAAGHPPRWPLRPTSPSPWASTSTVRPSSKPARRPGTSSSSTCGREPVHWHDVGPGRGSERLGRPPSRRGLRRTRLDVTRRQLVALGAAGATGAIVGKVATSESPAAAETRQGGIHI
jgi:hypothetical protein